MGKTFGIVKESYGGSQEQKDRLFAEIAREVIELGGRISNDYTKAMYAVMEDGHKPEIWQENIEEGHNFVHFRYILECKKQACMVDPVECIHLNPLPQKIPV